MAHRVFGAFGFVGVLAFIAHLIIFFYALAHGSPTPVGREVFRIVNHGDSAYVTFAWHVAIKYLEIVMLVGLGIGVGGELLLEALRKRGN
jgi:hypothetical protein